MVKISRQDKRISLLKQPTLAQAAIQERYDLQEFIFNSPEVFCSEIGQKLVILGKEVRPSDVVADRIDLLAVADDGVVVVLELKRGNDKLQLLQAISYAGMVSKWLPEEFLQRTGRSLDSIADQIPIEIDDINQDQRIILIAEAFDYEVLIGAQWLYEKCEVDIACVRVAAALDETTGSEYLNFTQLFPTRGLDELARKRGYRRSGQVSGAFNSWDELLSGVTNQAVAEFFRQCLDKGQENNLNWRELLFRIETEWHYSVRVRDQYARATQRGRFSEDIDFWRMRLSEPRTVQTGTKVHTGDRLRFQLVTSADFAAFEKAIDSELKTVKWEDVDSAQIQPSDDNPTEEASEHATGD